MGGFPTAPAWYRPLLLAEGPILKLLLPRLREGNSREQDPLSHHSGQLHGVAERLVPGADRGTDQHMPHHVSRYAWALRECEGKRVADLGCGVGYGTQILSSFAGTVVGVDVSPEAIEAAKRLYPSLDFRVTDLVEDPLPE